MYPLFNTEMELEDCMAEGRYAWIQSPCGRNVGSLGGYTDARMKVAHVK
jgi:hypothetical protein